jgi:formylglycine-generating enzyme required for sulfatase activity
MSDIFLSYKKEEKAIAKIYVGALELKGFTVWWDPDIDHGDIFDEVIQEQLDAAKCVIVLWSSKSVKSKWVRAEATSGEDRLVPVLINDVKIPVPFNLIQTANLIGWKGDQTDAEFVKLLESVSKKLGRSRPIKKEEYTNSIDMKFALIPAGEFIMGSNEYDSEKPEHEVTISKPFYLGVYPVTQQEWNTVMKKNPSRFKGEHLPIESVSWNDVQEFIKQLNQKEGSNKYRLPSEAEWEYAARAGTNTRYSYGDDESKLGDYAWYDENSDSKTHPVGQKKPNPWGLYDMHGNVWEWVQDKWHDNYNGAPTDGSSWEGGDGSDRVVRGGAWYAGAGSCRSANRVSLDPGGRSSYLGFRLLRIS